MKNWGSINRKEFLKLAGIAAGAALQASSWPGKRWFTELELPEWPSLTREQLPNRIQNIRQLCRKSTIDARGNLRLLVTENHPSGYVPLVPTQWNQEHSHPWDQLYTDVTWGIVLHWFGDHAEHNYGLENYLWGFNGLREVEGYLTRTSAHFLVGAGKTSTRRDHASEDFGIVQTQLPDLDGTPFQAAHLLPLEYEAYHEQRQYFDQLRLVKGQQSSKDLGRLACHVGQHLGLSGQQRGGEERTGEGASATIGHGGLRTPVRRRR